MRWEDCVKRDPAEWEENGEQRPTNRSRRLLTENIEDMKEKPKKRRPVTTDNITSDDVDYKRRTTKS